MSDPKKVIQQNAGFIKAEVRRASENLSKADEFHAAGNSRAAQAKLTQAKNQLDRAGRAANTIGERNKSG